MNLHLDTDLGGDPDDACALAMMLGWPGCELVGITTNLDPDGRRAGMVARLLDLAGRREIPIAAGATASLTTLASPAPKRDDQLYWGGPVESLPASPGAALDLLQGSIDKGAVVVAIGGCTNLALLEICRPGVLRQVPVVMMGGWLAPPAPGLPDWGPEKDWNVQVDTRAAEIVAGACSLTLVTLPVTLKAHLRAAHLPRLRASVPLGELLSRQTVAHSREAGIRELARAYEGLPDDLLNFHYDPVACAVALGWDGADVQQARLLPEFEGDVLCFRHDREGIPMQVVVDLDPSGFAETWLRCVAAV